LIEEIKGIYSKFEEVLEREKECEKELTAHTLTLISPTSHSIKSLPDYLTHSIKKQEGKTENQNQNV
jgi:hypothetical protein